MDAMDREKLIKAMVDDIIHDMCGRSGGDWWWEPISPPVKREIKRTWARLLRDRLKPFALTEERSEERP